MKPRKQSLFHGFYCAFAGIGSSINSEVNLKFHLFAAITAVALGFFFQISSAEWLWILLAIFLVLAAEVMNTAIESLSDLVSSAYHPLIKKTKDASAGAVLLLAVFALICGLIIFVPKMTEFFFSD